MHGSQQAVPATSRGAPSGIPAPVRCAVALAGLTPVGALVAWACGLGPFSTWLWYFSAPVAVVLVGAGGASAMSAGQWPRALSQRITQGVVGGVLATMAYDAVRAPFEVVGLRMLTPIDSYGLLALGAHSSSPLTSLAGWSYHFADGIGFGIAYAVLMSGRTWRWGLLWGASLETISLTTPLAGMYGLAGQPIVIALAYIGHFAYGSVLGLVAQGGDQGHISAFPPRAAVVAVAVVAAGLLLWLRPWLTPEPLRTAASLTPAPGAVMRAGRFLPEWMRVGAGHCVTVRNDDARSHLLTGGGRSTALAAHSAAQLCFVTPGVQRVKADHRPFSGGFVLIDPALQAGSR